MLRANLYKKFSKSNLPKAVDGVKTSKVEEPKKLYTNEDINSMFPALDAKSSCS